MADQHGTAVDDPAMADLNYPKEDRDLYETPSWMTAVLPKYIRGISGLADPPILEPAAGKFAMVNELGKSFSNVIATDIHNYGFPIVEERDFLTYTLEDFPYNVKVIATNPPFGERGKLSQKFIEKSLELMKPVIGSVIMCQRTDYDCAVTRRHIFGECPAYIGKVNFSKRPMWIADTDGHPRHYYSWYLWSWRKPNVTPNALPVTYHDYEAGR